MLPASCKLSFAEQDPQTQRDSVAHAKPSTRAKTKPKAKPRGRKVIPAIEPAPVVADFKPVLLRRLSATRLNQTLYLEAMAKQTLVFALGCAGTGKSFMAAGHAARELAAGRTKRLILTRPIIQCGGDHLGFLPGDLSAKVTPFMAPLLDSLNAFFSMADIEALLARDMLRITPMELMRGASYKDSIIICDEAQNSGRQQLEMLLTRIDHGTRLIFTGDERQQDLGGISPIVEIVRQLSTPEMLSSMSVVRFTRDDNMRSPIVAEICNRLGL